MGCMPCQYQGYGADQPAQELAVSVPVVSNEAIYAEITGMRADIRTALLELAIMRAHTDVLPDHETRLRENAAGLIQVKADIAAMVNKVLLSLIGAGCAVIASGISAWIAGAR
jgi:hypothetical protein